ncbi:MAG: hypothetical protein RIF34_06775 [Candidatus Kapaibacterium sp.]
MIRIIIIALLLATLWGCSDDKGSNLDEDKFPLIEGMEIVNLLSNKKDTIGNTKKVNIHCHKNEDYEIIVSWHPIIKSNSVHYKVKAGDYVKIKLETARASQELKDSLLSRYQISNTDHINYSDELIFEEFISASGRIEGLYNIFNEKGIYLVKVLHEGAVYSCAPVIVMERLGSIESLLGGNSPLDSRNQP